MNKKTPLQLSEIKELLAEYLGISVEDIKLDAEFLEKTGWGINIFPTQFPKHRPGQQIYFIPPNNSGFSVFSIINGSKNHSGFIAHECLGDDNEIFRSVAKKGDFHMLIALFEEMRRNKEIEDSREDDYEDDYDYEYEDGEEE
jgi:hypothetical protein